MWGAVARCYHRHPMPSRARQLRANPTEAEKRLWQALRDKQLDGHRFRRQASIGPYIADFVCFERRLVVEVDGGQHTDDTGDVKRTSWLESQGFRVLRFWNNEVLENREGVLERISGALSA